MSFLHLSTSNIAAGAGALFGTALISGFWMTKSRWLNSLGLKRSQHNTMSKELSDELERHGVHIKDRQRVNDIINNLISGGKDQLQVVADFDRTITRYTCPKGTLCDTCHNAIDESVHLPDSFKKEATQLRDTYYRIEVDPGLTIQQKYPYMVEWWTKAHGLLTQCNFSQKNIRRIVQEAKILLRDGCDWMLNHLDHLQVPLLVFSAGIGDIIEEVIRQQASLHDNIKIISNYMDFNNQGMLVGFKNDIIHVFNKNENAIHHSAYFEELSHRHNIVLLGDSLGDLHMADGATNVNCILKIGFLNDKVDQLLQRYMDLYDIVLVSDETMNLPNALFKNIY